MAKVFELKKDRTNEAAGARKIVELAVSEGRSLSADEETLVKASEERIAGMDRQIAVLERVEGIEAEGRSLPNARGDNAGASPAGGPDLDGKTKYSLLRAYRCALGLERGGLEAEVSQEIAARTGRPAQGLYIPWHLATHQAEQRTLNTTTGTGSIANVLGTQLIDLLRNRMVMNAMGATVLNDMTGGTFSLPKQTAASTAYWVAEGSAPTGSNLTVGQVTWTPKTIGALTDLTRKFILQTNQDAEMLARNDLAAVVARELDRVGINGSGSASQPLGILQDSSIPTTAINTNGGAPTWAHLCTLEKTVATSNADFGRLGYLTSNAGRSKMKQTTKIASSQYSDFLWEADQAGTGIGVVNGYRSMASEQVPSALTKGSLTTATALIFGNFASATYAFWSGLDVIVDPYTGSSTGAIRFVALQDADFQFRYEASFAKIVDLDPS